MIRAPILLDMPVPIHSKRLLIRPIMPGDGELMNQAVMESIDQFKEWLIWAHQPPTVKDSEKTARLFHADFILRKAMHLVIFKDEALIGMCSLHLFNWEVLSADIGYWLRKSAQGQGYMSEAVKAVTIYAFKQLGLKRLTIHCDEENIKSIQVADRAGFKLESKTERLTKLRGYEELRLKRCYACFDDSGLD